MGGKPSSLRIPEGRRAPLSGCISASRDVGFSLHPLRCCSCIVNLKGCSVCPRSHRTRDPFPALLPSPSLPRTHQSAPQSSASARHRHRLTSAHQAPQLGNPLPSSYSVCCCDGAHPGRSASRVPSWRQDRGGARTGFQGPEWGSLDQNRSPTHLPCVCSS